MKNTFTFERSVAVMLTCKLLKIYALTLKKLSCPQKLLAMRLISKCIITMLYRLKGWCIVKCHFQSILWKLNQCFIVRHSIRCNFFQVFMKILSVRRLSVLKASFFAEIFFYLSRKTASLFTFPIVWGNMKFNLKKHISNLISSVSLFYPIM